MKRLILLLLTISSLAYAGSSTIISPNSGGSITSNNTYLDNIYAGFGNTIDTPDAILGWNTTQTVDGLYLGSATGQNTVILAENGDKAFDFAHAAQTNPTLFIHSANQSTTQWLSLTHNQTNGLLTTGTGGLSLYASDATGVNLLVNAGIQLVGSAASAFTIQNSADSIGINIYPHFTTTTSTPALNFLNNPFGTSFSASSGTQTFGSFSFAVNQSSTAAYSALKVAATETSLGSGTSYLLQLLAGAAGSTEKFSITNLGKLTSTNTAIVDSSNAWIFTGTLPASTTGRTDAFKVAVTSAGSSANVQGGAYFTLGAGYTGSSYSIAMQADNTTAGTGTSYLTGAANIGGLFNSTATTTGSNVGFRGNAANGDVNAAIAGAATTAKNSATNIGAIAIALNTGTSPTQVGGFFGLMSAAPTLASAALMADNGSQTSDIFVARDNGSAVLTVADGGAVQATSTIRSSATGTIGWSVVSGANTACTTTCTSACVFGQNTATFAIVDCADATADVCVCAGAN